MRRIHSPGQNESMVQENCIDALEPAFEQLVDRATLAGWPRGMVLEALAVLARYEADAGGASTMGETA